MADHKLKLLILTPESTLFEGLADKVIVPASDGELGILPKHAPLVSLLGNGELRATANGRVDHYAVFGGYIRVAADSVSVLTDRAERADSIDADRAGEELERIKGIPAGRRSEEDLAEMERCRVRLRVKERA